MRFDAIAFVHVWHADCLPCNNQQWKAGSRELLLRLESLWFPFSSKIPNMPVYACDNSQGHVGISFLADEQMVVQGTKSCQGEARKHSS